MVTRSAAVKFGPRSIDNYQGYLCLYCNQRENNETLSDAGPRPPTFWTFGYGCAHKKWRIETKWRCQVALGRGKRAERLGGRWLTSRRDTPRRLTPGGGRPYRVHAREHAAARASKRYVFAVLSDRGRGGRGKRRKGQSGLIRITVRTRLTARPETRAGADGVAGVPRNRASVR